MYFSLLVCDISTDFAIKNDHFARFYGAVFLGGALLALAETLFQGILLLAAVAAVLCSDRPADDSAACAPSRYCRLRRTVALAEMAAAAAWIFPTALISFPVQQLIASCYIPFWPSLALSLIITIALGTLSAIMIERPALRRSRMQWRSRVYFAR